MNVYGFESIQGRKQILLPIPASLLNASAFQLQTMANDEFSNAGYNFANGFTHAAQNNAARAQFLQSLIVYKV